VKTILQEAETAFITVHESFCLESDLQKCKLNHYELIQRLNDYEKGIEARIRSEVAGDLEEARDFMVLTKDPEEGSAAMWIRFAFDKAVGFLRGENETS
jgi:hypothetical protein